MYRRELTFILLLMCLSLGGQTELARLPEPVSNNAVVAVTTSQGDFVYSFGGIGSGKTYKDIHKKVFKYDVQEDSWSQLSDLPSGNGRIAAAASVVNGLIYIIGGYEVFSNGQERSFRKVHVFDPETDQFLPDAPLIPRAIDDHVQVVWHDSLIYVISGWSDVTNVSDVQIFDPATNTWSMGTPVPSSIAYKVFGASGALLNDTIYYAGGASATRNFPPSNYLRKGAIDRSNPSSITWSAIATVDASGYRMACAATSTDIHWIGGSLTTYNYDGIAYNGTGGVSPSDQIRTFYPKSGGWINNSALQIPAVMDLRGIGQLSDYQYIIAGGMLEDQKVSDKTYLIELPIVSNTSAYPSGLGVFPNPISGNTINIIAGGPYSATLSKLNGVEIRSWSYNSGENVDVSSLLPGLYLLTLSDRHGSTTIKIIKQ